jgi:hypothetical protein
MAAQKPINVSLNNAHYLKSHASWLYCDVCNKTIAYLCYVTYGYFKFDFTCGCGAHGSAKNIFETVELDMLDKGSLEVKPENKKFCCEKDGDSLFSVVQKNLKSYSATVVCRKCKTKYEKSECEVLK